MVEAHASMPDHMIILTTGPSLHQQYPSVSRLDLMQRTSKVDRVVAFDVDLPIFDCIRQARNRSDDTADGACQPIADCVEVGKSCIQDTKTKNTNKPGLFTSTHFELPNK